MVTSGSCPNVFIVGPRWPQHSNHSGYDGFHEFVGTYISSPFKSRWPWANNAMQRVVPRPRYLFQEILSWLLTKASRRTYSWPIMATEIEAAFHMLRTRSSVYHVIYGETDFWFLGWIAKLTRNHLVVSFHDGESVVRQHGISSSLMAQVDGVILLAEVQRSFFASLAPSAKIYVAPHGIDTNFFHPVPAAPRQRMVVTAGGHTRDYVTFSKAIRRVWDVDPSIKFVAVSPNIGNLGEPFHLDGVECLTGISDDELRALYQSSRVAAFSFEWAIANNAVLEAMASGLPIVATDIGGVVEYVPADAGILFPSGDAEAMANGILELMNNEALASDMGASARRFAECLSYKKVAQKMMDIYLDVARAP